MTNLEFSITPAAAEFIKKKLVERGTPDSAMRVGIQGGKCEGFAYRVEYSDDPPREKDKVIELDGVKVYVDPKSLVFLNGAALDCEKSLMQYGLVIRNPNEASKCGCGASFTVK